MAPREHPLLTIGDPVAGTVFFNVIHKVVLDPGHRKARGFTEKVLHEIADGNRSVSEKDIRQLMFDYYAAFPKTAYRATDYLLLKAVVDGTSAVAEVHQPILRAVVPSVKQPRVQRIEVPPVHKTEPQPVTAVQVEPLSPEPAASSILWTDQTVAFGDVMFNLRDKTTPGQPSIRKKVSYTLMVISAVRGLSQKEMAALMDETPSVLSGLGSDSTPLTKARAEKWAEALRLSMPVLLGFESVDVEQVRANA